MFLKFLQSAFQIYDTQAFDAMRGLFFCDENILIRFSKSADFQNF